MLGYQSGPQYFSFSFAFQCTEISDWIDEEVGPFTEVELLKGKLGELQSLSKDLYARVEEHKMRPEVLAALHSMVNSSEHFLGKAKNDTEAKAPEDAYFTTTELELLDKKINETKQWMEDKMKIIEAQPLHEFPNVTNQLIALQGMDLDREVKYLVNKAKIAKNERDRKKKEKEIEERLKKEAAEKEEKAKAKKAKKDKKDKNETDTTESDTENSTSTIEDTENTPKDEG